MLLEVKDLVIRYEALDAIKKISIQMGERESIYIIGPNGAGKTTLLRAISGLNTPKIVEGEIARWVARFISSQDLA